MEEAEALSDRIVIMENGAVKWVGDSISLIEEYAGVYTVSLTVERNFLKKCQNILRKKLRGEFEIEVYNGTTLKFEIGFEGVKKIFELLKDEEMLKGKVSDWEFCQASLDDVFMNFGKEVKER